MRRAPQQPFQPYQGNYYNEPVNPYQMAQQQQNTYPPLANLQPPQQTHNIPPYQYFAKPAQPSDGYPESTMNGSYGQQAKGFINYFQDKDGQIDLDKMLNTVGQVANTYQQVSPLIKGIGSFMKGIK
ncbi:hypothetical protein GCM10011351_20310 [Paraliobacillus quinghaiensis]|uniref:Spore coat protein n=1 Tax=Paraliobacillus quinghaiensis TaxID=470815 RepID=A0A917WW37_9BACI|nr:YppG family protein [Paraliobacillus quinghaiensis]GGM34271.1 hypothetical protein GCM10011351_20310 [Paraliobacillus quinghaiensis]